VCGCLNPWSIAKAWKTEKMILLFLFGFKDVQKQGVQKAL